MKRKIIKKEIIVEVDGIKLHDEIFGDMVVGFSADGKNVYVREVGEVGGMLSIEAIKVLERS